MKQININTICSRIKELFPGRDLKESGIWQLPDGEIKIQVRYAVHEGYTGADCMIDTNNIDNIDGMIECLKRDVERNIKTSEEGYLVYGADFTEEFKTYIDQCNDAQRLCNDLNREKFMIKYYEDFKNEQNPPRKRDPRRLEYIENKMIYLYGSVSNAYKAMRHERQTRMHRIMEESPELLQPADEEEE